MASFSVSKLEKDNLRIKRQRNLAKRNRHKKWENIVSASRDDFEIPIIKIKERISRKLDRNTCRDRQGSHPTRQQRVHREFIKRFPEHTVADESESSKEDNTGHRSVQENRQWIHPFTNSNNTTPQIQISIDGKIIPSTVDTGASRVMITSKLAEDIWGVNVTNTLRQYGNKKVTDAQGQEVKVVGMKNAVIKLGTHLTATYPVVVYQAEHKEMLLGWSFLSDFKLAVYTGCGIGSQPEVAMVKRLNFADEQMECFTKKEEYVPPQAVKVITARIKMPATWSAQDRIQMVGSSIVTHSEDIEGTPINCITVPYSYDIIRINDDVQVIVDNSQNLEPLHIERGQLIAHAELIIEQVENEQILRILDDAASITSEKSMGEIEKDRKKKERSKKVIG